MKVYIILLLSVLMLSNCGGGSGGNSSPSTPPLSSIATSSNSPITSSSQSSSSIQPTSSSASSKSSAVTVSNCDKLDSVQISNMTDTQFITNVVYSSIHDSDTQFNFSESCGSILYSQQHNVFTSSRITSLLNELQTQLSTFNGIDPVNMRKINELFYTLAGAGYSTTTRDVITNDHVIQYITIINNFVESGNYLKFQPNNYSNDQHNFVVAIFTDEFVHSWRNLVFTSITETSNWYNVDTAAQVTQALVKNFSNLTTLSKYLTQLSKQTALRTGPTVDMTERYKRNAIDLSQSATAIITLNEKTTIPNLYTKDALDIALYNVNLQGVNTEADARHDRNWWGPEVFASQLYSGDITILDPYVTNIVANKFNDTHVRLIWAFDHKPTTLKCSQFTKSNLLCNSNSLQDELKNTLLPNSVTTETGKYYSSLTKNTLWMLDQSLQPTKATFFKFTGATRLVLNDSSTDLVNIVIFKNRYQYETLANMLFNINTDNGGVYIERSSTLYTYDRPYSDELSLQELLRHEFGHYLISRYIIPGTFGDTHYTNNRLTWIDEGLANLLAGANRIGNPTILKSVSARADEKYTITDVTKVTYQDDYLYPSSTLLFNMVVSNAKEVIPTLAQLSIIDDINGLNNYITTLASDTKLNDKYQQFVFSAKSSNFTAPWNTTKYSIQNQTSASVKQVLTSHGYKPTCVDKEYTYSCQFTINNPVGSLTDILANIRSISDSILTTSDDTVLNTSNCYPIDIGTTTSIMTCSGYLN